MKRFLSQVTNSWTLLIIIFILFILSSEIQAKFGLKAVDGSIWAVGFPIGCGLFCGHFFVSNKDRGMNVREIIEFGISSLILFMVLIIWVAPRIWNYIHTVQFLEYFKISLVHWIGFWIFFLITMYFRVVAK